MGNYSLSEQDIKNNIKCNTLNGIYSVLALNLVTPFIGILAKNLGAEAYEIAMLSSFPALMSVLAMIPGSILVDQYKEKKKITGLFIFITRFFFILLALTPQLPAPYRISALIIIYSVMNFPGGLSGVSWQSFIATAIPPERRAQAFATRNKITSICGMTITLIAGQILRMYKGNSEIKIYQLFFIIAFGFALLEVYYHLRMKEPIFQENSLSTDQNSETFNNKIKQVLTHKPFVLFSLCSLLFHFGWQMGWPLFTIYQIDYLGADGTWISYLSVGNGLAGFITYPLWSKLVNKKGNNYAVILATFSIAMSPFLFAISWNLYILLVVNFFMGTAVAGISLVLFNLLLEVVPNENRTLSIALYNTLISLSAIVSPMVGAFVYETFGSIYLALITAGTFRMLGSFTFLLRYKFLTKSTTKVSNFI
ncbi:Major Facilitator Superfamily protein [Anaerobranca californiensis DSM 14826]|jgi:MFS family permease|uniref:Major Facilitator Superfamily protein n=1 Tax=Anaerobranca californiensis DSM 14826 TaxID=1120989 RepID=A0A1M6NML1_9FIRM|nr:MFS transporter [Anaerobranca californiensis]SHJ96987.1 Major Facilitator Superfamily protein [Anaerobranca californiensis DSM 14826]